MPLEKGFPRLLFPRCIISVRVVCNTLCLSWTAILGPARAIMKGNGWKEFCREALLRN
jgi:hypothetical protein